MLGKLRYYKIKEMIAEHEHLKVHDKLFKKSKIWFQLQPVDSGVTVLDSGSSDEFTDLKMLFSCFVVYVYTVSSW